MRGDHDPLAAADGRCQALVPAGQHPCHGVLQTFGQRHLAGSQGPVARIEALAARIVGRQHRRRRVVAAAPDQHLLVAELARHVGLVQALQGAVVALVEAPVVLHRQPGAIQCIQRVPQGPHRALEHRGIGDVEVVARLREQLAGLTGLLDAGGRQRHIGPTGEAVLQVPGRFPMPDQDELVHGSRFYNSRFCVRPRAALGSPCLSSSRTGS